MPDIREILAALDIDDRALWSEHRTIMRRSYLNAHNSTVGIDKWTFEDDAFMDLIDIRLALLFDRAGRLQATTDILGQDDKATEQQLHDAEDAVKYKQIAGRIDRASGKAISIAIEQDKAILETPNMTAASKLLSDGFGSTWAADKGHQ